MAAITELDYGNGNNLSTSATDTVVAAGGNFGDFIEVTFDASENPNDFVVALFHDNGQVAAVIRLDQLTVNTYTGPGNSQVVVLGSDQVPATRAGFTGQDASGWTGVDFSSFTTSAAYAAGNTYAAGNLSSNNPAGGIGDLSPAGGTGNQTTYISSFLNGGNSSTNFLEFHGVMLYNDATGSVVDFFTMAGPVGPITAVTGPGAGTTSTQLANPGGGQSFNWNVAGNNFTPDVQNPGVVACFVTGTQILTKTGYRAVETLRVGDMVETLDSGPQPLRWLGATQVRAEDAFAPVFIPSGALGNEQPLYVSQLHRFCLEGSGVELAIGQEDCLICAKHLIGFKGICLAPRTKVTYWHLLLDQHQLIWANGSLTESFYPGPQALGSIEADVQAEITSLFPDLEICDDEGYGNIARPVANEPEARAILRYFAD